METLFPFGNSVWEFWTTFQEIPFSPVIFFLGRPKIGFNLHSNRKFQIFVVSDKQPWKYLEQSVLFPKGLNRVSRFDLL